LLVKLEKEKLKILNNENYLFINSMDINKQSLFRLLS